MEELLKFKERLSREFRIQRMILFGSRARGDHLRTSDIDLIVISEDFRGMHFLERIRRIARLWDGDLRLEVLPYTPEELERKAREISIVSAALKEGVEI